MDFEGRTFSGDVHLDGNSYKDCTFLNANLTFSAVAPTALSGNRFNDCRWSFAGPAALTVRFLTGLYNGVGQGGRELVESTFEDIRQGGDSRGSRPETALVSFKPKIFVGHGHSSDYAVLSDFLRQRGFTVETFESRSRVGMTAKEVLESMASRASMAFLVHTAEDEQAGGTARARQNVVHETGLFQGRLGFMRALVVREEGYESFTNLDGVQELRYPRGGLRSIFFDLLEAIDREFPQPNL